MDFADSNILLVQCCQALVCLLELNGKMAGIVVHAQVQTKARIARPPLCHLREKRQCLLRVLEQSERLRFDTEMQGVAGTLAQFGDMIDAAPKVFCDRIDLAAVAPETFVRTG